MKLSHSKIKLFVFFLYNMTYVLYMLGYMNRLINLGVLGLFILMCAYEFFVKAKNKDLKLVFTKELKSALMIIITFFSISIIIQIINNDFELYLISELLYNIIPITIAFFWINTTEKKDCMPYFYIFFIRAVAYFIFKNFENLSIKNVFLINWNDSKSSIFESPFAHDFLFLEIIFLYTNKKKLALSSMILCMLSFKRISFILSLLVFIVSTFFKGNEKLTSKLHKKANKKIICLIFICMCCMPLILNWMVSLKGISYFYSRGVNLNEFTTGRVGIIQYVQKNMKYYNGYGSTDNYLENCTYGNLAVLGSMHCDILKLYYEVTELGVIIYIYEMLKIGYKKNIILYMLLYLFLELISSHFLDVLSVWNMFFMFTAFVYKKENIEYKNDE